MDDRLKSIEQRAEALGWEWFTHCEYSDYIIAANDFHLNFNNIEHSLHAAERLLALYEPGARVQVEHDISVYEEYGTNYGCGELCGLRAWDDNGSYCVLSMHLPKKSPTPYCCPSHTCPGPGRYKLVRVEEPDAC